MSNLENAGNPSGTAPVSPGAGGVGQTSGNTMECCWDENDSRNLDNITNNTQLIATSTQRAANALERAATALERISDDIRALKIIGVDHNAGIVTRGTCNPCDLGNVNNMSRALTVVALKSSKQLGDVITELQSPTSLPTPSQNF